MKNFDFFSNKPARNVKTFLRWVFAIVLACVFSSLMATPSSEQHTVDFSKSDNLKAIFDAGLRPRQYLGLPGGCELHNENLKIILPENCSFDLEIESAEIYALAGNQIARIDFECGLKPIAQATANAKKICEQFGINTSNFDIYLDARERKDFTVRSKPLLAKKGNISIQIVFDDSSIVSANIMVVLEWAIPNEKMEFITGPMKPPPGYEDVSMAPPSQEPSRNLASWYGLLALVAILVVITAIYAIKKKPIE
jgi:hypothetical protein